MKKVIISAFLCMAVMLCLSSCDRPMGGVGETTGSTGDATDARTEVTTSEQASESESATEQTSEDESMTEEDTGKGAENGKKRLYSDSGTQLNLVVEYWFDEGENGQARLHADVMLECYSLSVTARNNAQNYIRLGEQTQYFATDAIDYSGKEQKYFKLGSFVFVLDSAADKLPIEAVWTFGGTYNDKPISKLIIENEITVGETGTK